MKTIQTRFLLLKKQWFNLFFWLLFPILITWGIVTLAHEIEDDAKIPIGLVIQDSSAEAAILVDRINKSTILNVYEFEEVDAVQSLLKHELDSVFVINEGYNNNIKNNDREDLIKGYHSNLSLAYVPVKEAIVSFVQKDTGRSKATAFIQELYIKRGVSSVPTRNEIIERINNIEEREHLLDSTLIISDKEMSKDTEQSQFLNPLYIWMIALTLATFFIFDWIIREKNSAAAIRLRFTRSSFKAYIIYHFIFYTVLLATFDTLALYSLSMLLAMPTLTMKKIFAFVLFRLTLNFTVLLFAVLIRKLSLYYAIGIGFTLFMTITSTAILPIEHLYKTYPWLYYINPLQPFIHNEAAYIWLVSVIGLLIIWLVRRENSYA